MSDARIRLGTRASKLALVQADTVATALRACGITVEIVTAGDIRRGDTPWGEGAFVDALELVAGLLHGPTKRLRDDPGDARVALARDLFGVGRR